MDWVKEKMHQARLNRIQIQKQEQFNAPDQTPQKNKKLRINRPDQPYDSSQRLVLLSTGLASAAIIVIVLWSANLIDLGTGAGIDRLQSKDSMPAHQTVEPQEGYIKRDSKAEVRGDEIQTDSVSGLETLPPTAAGKAKASTLTNENTNTSGTATRSDLETKSMQSTVDGKIQRQEPDRDSGTWAINLASLQQKLDAEHFVAKVNSKGVAADIYQVTVRGKKYWRVQVPGFSSAEQAKAKASEVKNTLGLKDVWVVQRQ